MKTPRPASFPALLALLALVLATACATEPPPAAPSPPPAGPTKPASAGSAQAEVEALVAKAREAADSNHLAEAIRSWIAVIAIFEESRDQALRPRAEAAAAELQRIGQRLSLEPGSEWLDGKGSQIAGSARNAGKSEGLSPSVYLFENFGAGKSPVADAPIHFEFAENSGSLLSPVSTDAYGKANTTIARLDEPGKAALVRAYPVFRARDKSYAFRSVSREFSYLPPAGLARVAVLETTEFGASDNPQTADALTRGLKPLGLQLAPLNGKLAAESFRLALGGDRRALAALGIDSSVPFGFLVSIEVDKARQMELNGKKYNIFTTAARASFRLVRSDGSAAFALPLDGLKGQGGTPEAAAADGLKKAREALVAEVEARLAAIRTAIEKE